MVIRTRIVATLLLVTAVARAFSYSAIPRSSRTTTFAQGATGTRSLSSIQQHSRNSNTAFLSIRGGQQEVEEPEVLDAEDFADPTLTTDSATIEEEDVVEQIQAQVTSDSKSQVKAAGVGTLGTMATSLARVGSLYGSALESSPVLTKSVTAGFIFAISDYLAQRFEASSSAADKEKKLRLNLTRIATSAAVGLFYFGPAAHVWYSWIFRILPGTSLFSILQKAALGQMFFGPSFTCIFFATGLLQSGTFSLGNWVRKIRQDLPGAWLAGASFWPLIDLVSFSLVPQKWIPLFVNMASLVWTIYLSTIANRGTSTSSA
jgi:protein Mpv17